MLRVEISTAINYNAYVQSPLLWWKRGRVLELKFLDS